MATARDIIKRSLRLIHVLDAGEEPTAAEATDCLAALNAMLDTWSAQRLYIYTVKEEDLTWPASTESRTIGASGDFTSTRPTSIEESTYITDSDSNDYLLRLLFNRQAYTSIVNKSVESDIPEYLYYEPDHPNGIMYLWPVPSSAITLHLHTPEQLSSLSALTTTFAMPPGYQDAVTYSLCQRLAPEFGVALPPEVQMTAMKATKAIKSLNRKVPIVQVEAGYIGNTIGTHYNVNVD